MILGLLVIAVATGSAVAGKIAAAMALVVVFAIAAVLVPGIFLGRLARRRGAAYITPRAVRLTVLIGSFAFIMQSVGIYAHWIPPHGPWFVLNGILTYGYAILAVTFVTVLLPEFWNRCKAHRKNLPPPRDPFT